jgi:hypothetical protein
VVSKERAAHARFQARLSRQWRVRCRRTTAAGVSTPLLQKGPKAFGPWGGGAEVDGLLGRSGRPPMPINIPEILGLIDTLPLNRPSKASQSSLSTGQPSRTLVAAGPPRPGRFRASQKVGSALFGAALPKATAVMADRQSASGRPWRGVSSLLVNFALSEPTPHPLSRSRQPRSWLSHAACFDGQSRALTNRADTQTIPKLKGRGRV